MKSFLTFEQINEIANRIRRHFHVDDEYFIDVTSLAKNLGCKVKEVVFDNNKIAGTLEINDDDSTIYVNREDSEERKRFTIAHEIAHFILHKNDGSRSYVDYRQPLEYYKDPIDLKKEVQANMLAAALLMPVELVEKEWKINPDIDDLAQVFHVSRRAVTIRLETLGLLE